MEYGFLDSKDGSFLDPGQVSFLEGQVKSGRFASAEAALREAVDFRSYRHGRKTEIVRILRGSRNLSALF
jgi:Arc/MetJ-type ribon-helix-helix transcriptional regulator